MTEKKRKRHSELHRAKETKRPVLEKPSETITVVHRDEEKTWTPVIASQPGLSLTKLGDFKTYKNDSTQEPKLFLHSEAHPTLDITAAEETYKQTSEPLAHYVGIYDARRQRLKLVPARYMTIHSTLKSSRPQPQSILDAQDPSKTPKPSTRADLGLAFGSKKTQKILRDRMSNNITSGKPIAEDPVATALLETLPKSTINEEEIRAASDAQRPVPRPNYEATRPADVYTIANLVDGEDKLAKVPVKDWIDAANTREGVPYLCSQYVSARAIKICLNESDIKTVRLLRYLYLLILFYRSLTPPRSKRDLTKTVPKFDFTTGKRPSRSTDFLGAITSEFAPDLVHSVILRFSSKNEVTRWQSDHLITHIMAISLHIDGFASSTYGLEFDLLLEKSMAAKYYKQLGCQTRKIGKREAETGAFVGMHPNPPDRRVAELKVPVVMPKMKTRR